MLNPANLVVAFGLAKLQEEYIQSFRRPIRSSNSSFSFGRQQSWSHILLPPPKPSSGFQVQRIFTGQMKERHDKDLFYYFDDKWQ
jgi:hypothetical protein